MSNLHMGKPIRLMQADIIPIEMVSLSSVAVERGCWTHGFKELAAIIVCNADGIRILDVQEQRWSLTELIGHVPGLKSVLAQFAACR